MSIWADSKKIETLCRTTVKPVYNRQPWDPKKAAVWKRCLIKLIFKLVVVDSNWQLFTGGLCSQVVVNLGLTVYRTSIGRYPYPFVHPCGLEKSFLICWSHLKLSENSRSVCWGNLNCKTLSSGPIGFWSWCNDV